jgi:hypothetical protein
VLLNLAMKHCEMPYSKEQIAVDLAVIDRFYVGNGWYYDGVETQVDYSFEYGISQCFIAKFSNTLKKCQLFGGIMFSLAC